MKNSRSEKKGKRKAIPIGEDMAFRPAVVDSSSGGGGADTSCSTDHGSTNTSVCNTKAAAETNQKQAKRRK